MKSKKFNKVKITKSLKNRKPKGIKENDQSTDTIDSNNTSTSEETLSKTFDSEEVKL